MRFWPQVLTASATVALVACLGACDRSKDRTDGAPPVVPTAVSSATAPASARGAVTAAPNEGRVDFPEVPIKAGATTTVHVTWKAPAGTGVNEDAPFRVRWSKSDALEAAPADVKATGAAAKNGFSIDVKPLSGAPNATLGGVIDLVVCDVETHLVCVPVKRTVDIEFVVGKGSPPDTTVAVPLPQARPRT